MPVDMRSCSRQHQDCQAAKVQMGLESNCVEVCSSRECCFVYSCTIVCSIRLLRNRKNASVFANCFHFCRRTQGKVNLMKAKAVQDLLAEYKDPSAVRKVTIKSTRYDDSDESSDNDDDLL